MPTLKEMMDKDLQEQMIATGKKVAVVHTPPVNHVTDVAKTIDGQVIVPTKTAEARKMIYDFIQNVLHIRMTTIEQGTLSVLLKQLCKVDNDNTKEELRRNQIALGRLHEANRQRQKKLK